MRASSKRAYRNIYLKSDQWKDVRLEALVRTDASCCICGYRSLSNDAHHVVYPQSFWDTRESDLVVLCRPCHNFIHCLLPTARVGRNSFALFMDTVAAIRRWRGEVDCQDADKIEAIYRANRLRLKEKTCRACRIYGPSVDAVCLFDGKPGSLPLCSSCGLELAGLKPNSWAGVRRFLEKKGAASKNNSELHLTLDSNSNSGSNSGKKK